jgi:3-phosphoshikimate 1-carboxyvinyltransferase
MDLVFEPARALSGEVRVPGDKSITHRAYLLASVAYGETTITGANDGADCRATLAALAALGAGIERGEAGALVVHRGTGGFASPGRALDLGNSGTGLRLLAGLLAGQGVSATLTGDASLLTRPMRRIVEPLRAMGAYKRALGADDRPPLEQRARLRPLRGIDSVLPVASAQVKSCLLLAGLGAQGTTRVTEPLASRDHTERMIAAFGGELDRESPLVCAVTGPAILRAPPVALDVPGDFSAAYFWLVAGSIAEAGELTLRNVGLNPGRIGGLAVLRRMGADITISNQRERERLEGGETVGDLTVRPATLEATDVLGAEIPGLVDELPALAVAQACARGVSRVSGAGELRVKESDRISTVVNALRALGGKADEAPDGWEDTGGPLKGGAVETRGDHRIGMAFGVAALRADGPVTVREGEMIDTSYPCFYSDLRDRVTSR